jgi:hypothetical protein
MSIYLNLESFNLDFFKKFLTQNFDNIFIISFIIWELIQIKIIFFILFFLFLFFLNIYNFILFLK